LLALLILTAAGCAQRQVVYLLPDGRVANADPVLNRQLQADLTICNDERARSIQGGDHGDGSQSRGSEVDKVGDECMTDKGYIEVRQDQVPATQQQLAATRGGVQAPARN
jgi:hypothetical protein